MKILLAILFAVSVVTSAPVSCAHALGGDMDKMAASHHTGMSDDDHAHGAHHDMTMQMNAHGAHDMPEDCMNDCDGGTDCEGCAAGVTAIFDELPSMQAFFERNFHNALTVRFLSLAKLLEAPPPRLG